MTKLFLYYHFKLRHGIRLISEEMKEIDVLQLEKWLL